MSRWLPPARGGYRGVGSPDGKRPPPGSAGLARAVDNELNLIAAAIDSEAAISAVPGQMDRLEALAERVRRLR